MSKIRNSNRVNRGKLLFVTLIMITLIFIVRFPLENRISATTPEYANIRAESIVQKISLPKYSAESKLNQAPLTRTVNSSSSSAQTSSTPRQPPVPESRSFIPLPKVDFSSVANFFNGIGNGISNSLNNFGDFATQKPDLELTQNSSPSAFEEIAQSQMTFKIAPTPDEVQGKIEWRKDLSFSAGTDKFLQGTTLIVKGKDKEQILTTRSEMLLPDNVLMVVDRDTFIQLGGNPDTEKTIDGVAKIK